MYEVKIYHQRPCYRNGDKEAETILYDASNFKTKALALEFIEYNLKQKEKQRATIKRYKKENLFYAYMGNTWIHENTGDKYEETFCYELKKL